MLGCGDVAVRSFLGGVLVVVVRLLVALGLFYVDLDEEGC
jgi:hypothetical protein